MATQFKIQYQGTTYNYTSNITDKTVNSISYTAKTISRSEIFFEIDRQSCTITVDASIAPFSLIKDRRPQVPMTIDLIDDSGAVFMTSEISSADVTTSSNVMQVKLDAMRKLERTEIPNRSISQGCSFSLYDGSSTKACPADRNSFKTTFSSSITLLWSIDSTDKRKLNFALTSLTVNAYQLGHAVFKDTSGNELARYYIVSNANNSISFLSTIEIDLADVGSFDVYKGCNKRLVTSGACNDIFNVNEHFGGFPLAFNHGGEKQKDSYIPIVYGKDVHVDAKIIYALDKAIVSVHEVDHGHLAYLQLQSFGIGLARKLDSLSRIYTIDENENEVSVTPVGMSELTSNGATTTAVFTNSLHNDRLTRTHKIWFFGEQVTLEKHGYLGRLSETTATFYDGTQSSADSYYNSYASTDGNINEMYYKDVAKVDFGFNGIAKDLSTAGKTGELAQMKNYNGGINYSNATQALTGFIRDLDFENLGQEQFPLPDMRAIVSFSPTLAGSTDNATIGSAGNQGANPANVVYDLLINHLNIDSADIDTTSFATARNTLAGETTPLGVNIVIDKPTSVKKIIDDVCAFAGMVLTRGSTGATGSAYKWTLKVLRFTDTATESVYPLGNQFNASNTSNVKLKFSGPDKIYSDIKMELFEPTLEKKTNYVFVNEAARNLIGGVKSKKVSYGNCKIYSREIFKALISREASKLTRPLNQITFKYFQAPNNERLIFPGDIVFYKNEQYGISDYKKFRVLEVSGLREANHERTIKAIELWDETAFAGLPDDFIVPEEVTAGTAGSKLIIPAAQEMTFPHSAITGAIGNTSTNSAFGVDIWSTNPLDARYQQNALMNFDCAIIGSVTSGFDPNNPQFLDTTGNLQFTLDSGSSDYLKNIDIPENQFWAVGGLFAIIGESGEYEFLSIRKITESGGTYTCYDVIRNYFGGWNLANPLFGTEDHGYGSPMKIYIYGDIGGGSSGRMKTLNIAGHIDLTVSDDEYLTTKNEYKYLAGGVSSGPDTNNTRILNFAGAGGNLVFEKQNCVFPYPITDGEISSTSDLNDSIAIVFSPAFPRAPRGCNLRNHVKENGWGFSGDYTRGVDLPDYWVDIAQSGVETESYIVRFGDFKYSLASKSAQVGYNGLKSLSLYALKNGIAENLYKEGYLRLTIQYDTAVFSDPDTITIYSFWNGIKSEGVTFDFP